MLRAALSPLRLLAAAAVVIVAALVVLITRGSDHYLEIPDKAHPLAGLVKVSGTTPSNDSGGIYYVDVLIKRASLLESLVPAIRPSGSDLVSRRQIIEPGITEKQRFKLELADMQLSQLTASTVALRALGYRVLVRLGGLRVVAITSDSHAAGVLKPGDVIISAEGKRVRSRDDLRAVLAKHRKEYAANPEDAKKVLGIGDAPMPKDMAPAELAAWTSVCRVVLNLHETITRQ